VIGAFLVVLRGCVSPAGAELDRLVASATEDEFFLFLAARREQGCASAEVHRSALLQLQLGVRVQPFASSAAVTRATRAVGIAARAAKVDKGSLTTAMAVDMVALQTDAVNANALAPGFAADLWISELAHIRAGDLQAEGYVPDAQQLVLRIAKANRAGSPQSSQKLVSALAVQVCWGRASKGRVRRAFADAAVALQWPADLNWYPPLPPRRRFERTRGAWWKDCFAVNPKRFSTIMLAPTS
jgi:hypothetical protein